MHFLKKILKNTRPLYDACRTTLTSLESIYRAILNINMPNEDLFMGLNRYTKYFLFLREAYTNAPIYFILFYFILFYFCRQGSRGKDANNEKSYFLFIFVKKELKGNVVTRA